VRERWVASLSLGFDEEGVGAAIILLADRLGRGPLQRKCGRRNPRTQPGWPCHSRL